MADDEEVAQAPPVGAPEVRAVSAMLLMFVAAQALAVLLTPSFGTAGIEGFEDAEDWTNGIVLIGIILVFTALILWIAKAKKDKVIQWIILASVGLTVAYVFYALFFSAATLADFGFNQGPTGVVFLWVVSLALAALPTWLLYTYPEWYVVDLVGILVSAGAIAIFGTSFTPATYLVVLVGTAVYDAISVYKTKHMLDLADSVLTLHLPIMLIVPKSKGYSFLDEAGGLRDEATKAAEPPASSEKADGDDAEEAAAKKPRDAMFIGLGDLVIPGILIVSAMTFTGAWSAFGAFVGMVAGFLVLMSFVLKGKAHAGLPALNGGAFLGFLAGFYVQTGTLTFW